MSIRHGFWHSFLHGLSFVAAIFISVVCTAVFRKFVPGVIKWLDGFSSWLIRFFKIDWGTNEVTTIIVALLAVIVIGFFLGRRHHE